MKHCVKSKGLTNFRYMKKTFTLVELLIVVAVVAILAGIGYPSYTKVVKHARQRDAKVQVGLLQTAEKIHYLDYGQYIPCSGTGASSCNKLLNLNLSEGGKDNYAFSVTVSGGGTDISQIKGEVGSCEITTASLDTSCIDGECSESGCQ